MEDILSSIRRVIARDEPPGIKRKQRATDEDVLDLQDQDAGDKSKAVGDKIAGTEATKDEAIEAPQSEDELVSSASAEAARQSLDALTAAVAPSAASPATDTPVRSPTLEDLVLEMLRPMLKDWLDTNLPPLVEAMVAKEISRITSRKG